MMLWMICAFLSFGVCYAHVRLIHGGGAYQYVTCLILSVLGGCLLLALVIYSSIEDRYFPGFRILL